MTTNKFSVAIVHSVARRQGDASTWRHIHERTWWGKRQGRGMLCGCHSLDRGRARPRLQQSAVRSSICTRVLDRNRGRFEQRIHARTRSMSCLQPCCTVRTTYWYLAWSDRRALWGHPSASAQARSSGCLRVRHHIYGSVHSVAQQSIARVSSQPAHLADCIDS